MMLKFIRLPVKKCSAEVTAAIISAGAALAGTGASLGVSSSINKKNRDWQEKMYHQQVKDNRLNAEEAHRRNLEIMNKEAAYNSEAAQVARLKAAGLNPALMYESAPGSSISGGSSSIASPGSPGSPSTYLPDTSAISGAGQQISDQFYQSELQKAKVNDLNKSAQQKFEQAKLFAKQSNMTEQQTERFMLENGIIKDTREYEIRMKKLNCDRMQVLLDTDALSYDTAKQLQPLIIEAQRLSNDDLEKGISLKTSQIVTESLRQQNIQAHTSLTESQERELNVKIEKYWQEMLTLGSQAYYYDTLAQYSSEGVLLRRAEKKKLDLENTLNESYAEIDRQLDQYLKVQNIELKEAERHEVISRIVANYVLSARQLSDIADTWLNDDSEGSDGKSSLFTFDNMGKAVGEVKALGQMAQFLGAGESLIIP